ncbi:MAG: DUF1684 domain-containing protein, partial [Thermomicrobiales bacterium]
MSETRLSRFRHRKDEYFAQDEHSPLTPEQREQFAGLVYFDERPALALTLELDASGEDAGEAISLGTTDGTVKPFVRAGTVRFDVDGSEVAFTVYKEPDRGRFYLPFRDGTAGTETYPVGRYLDPQIRPDGRLVVDFNYAYNPYCAYGDGWSCPIPPRENITSVRIEAGEKDFPNRAYGIVEHEHEHEHEHE